MTQEQLFRRNLTIVAVLHGLAVLAFVFYGHWQRDPVAPAVVWLDGGALSAGAAAAAPAPEPVAEPPPPELVEREPIVEPPPERPDPPSELVQPKATPMPMTPRPSTPKPATPKPTAKPSPKPTPKKVTPKATPKTASAKTTSPKPASPKAATTPKITPGADPAGDATATARNEAGPAGKAAGAGSKTGTGKGAGKTGGGGNSTSELAWYFEMLHDRFYSRWLQPTSLIRSETDFTTTVRLKIAKDGTVASRQLVKSSGNPVMDESVMLAANKVAQVDPLPAGLGGEAYEVNLQFKLDQGQ
ncbi:MAG: TonB family protein [Verrucomicrobiota bacterium]|nr:TonB family protein [Verrucomicrobiota bacterium]